MKRFLACAAMMLALSAPAHAQQVDAATQARLDLASRIGSELYWQDQSAWHVTDALMEVVPDTLKEKPIGYITERLDASHVRTTFILTENDRAEILYVGVTLGSKVEKVEDYTRVSDRPLATPAQAERLATIRKLHDENRSGLCGQRPNIIAFPAMDQPGATDYYLLVPETETSQAQFGGHQRVRILADGSREKTSYSNSCISLDLDAADGNEVMMLAISVPENVSDIPTEIHVFESISHKIPVMVGTVKGFWEVTGHEITMIDPEKPKPE